MFTSQNSKGFLSVVEYNPMVLIYQSLLVYLSIEKNLRFFFSPFWAITNEETMKILVQVFVCTYIFIFLGCMPKSANVGIHGNYMLIL